MTPGNPSGPAGPLTREELIRTLGVGLVAVAALVLSLSVARQRSDARRDASEDASGRAPAAAKLDLNALRTAGL